MKIEVHVLARNEEDIMGYTLRHYSTFADTIWVHDAGSTDRTREIAQTFDKVVLVEWDTANEFNDLHNINLKNRCWRGTDAHWVILADCDELLYCPLAGGWIELLKSYGKLGFAVIKPHGFEMFSETFPTGPGQIYDYVKIGSPDPAYSKPILFAPSRVESIEYGAGAHQCQYTLKDGQRFEPVEFTEPACYLLHFHQIGPKERIAARYDERLRRISPINRERGWGNFKPGAVHVLEKRDRICPGLQQVIP